METEKPMFAFWPNLQALVAAAELGTATKREVAAIYANASHALQRGCELPDWLGAFVGQRLQALADLLARQGSVHQQAYVNAMVPSTKERRIAMRDLVRNADSMNRLAGITPGASRRRLAAEFSISADSVKRYLAPSTTAKPTKKRRRNTR